MKNRGKGELPYPPAKNLLSFLEKAEYLLPNIEQNKQYNPDHINKVPK